ncbi:hypothetical protein JDV09_21070 [Mycobacterium sp. Y57]|uniref:hypothetical protein n=1 Tax=Mycolicibacterium xanthum TaxID=2796469 RepID=UPI001C844E9D|nr:hypothetical protein [Mycolicibacterium xanthum]MBX7434569.1 hypothetical protein [Mycolicibacterium xanthum]
MSDESAEPVNDPVDGPETPQDTPAEDTPDSGGSGEAARYRHQLRDAEAARDDLAAKLETLQRVQVDAQVTAAGVRPAALWATGVALSDLVGADGTVDADLVAAAVAATREHFGITPPSPRRRLSVKGLKSGLGAPSSRANRWSAAFSPDGLGRE